MTSILALTEAVRSTRPENENDSVEPPTQQTVYPAGPARGSFPLSVPDASMMQTL